MEGVGVAPCYCTKKYFAILSSVPGVPNISGAKLPSIAWIPFDVTVEFGSSKICEMHCHGLAFSFVVNCVTGPTV